MTTETVLVLGDVAIPLGAGRAITQTLEPIDNGDLRRTVNGTLKDLTREENRKFASTISTSDWSSPAFEGLWKGMTLTVQCITEMRQNVFPVSEDITLVRPAVEGTVYGVTEDGVRLAPALETPTYAEFDDPVRYVVFRPELEFMVTSISRSRDEYAVEESWQIGLEEV